MDKLLSLAELVSRQKIAQAKIIDEVALDENKMSTLYNHLADGKIKNDSDAYNFLYDGIENASSLRKLKERLHERLLNSVFFIDQGGANYKDIFLAGKSCYKNYALAKLLLANRKRELAIDLAVKTLRISEKYEFTDLNYLLTSILATHYSLFSIKPHKSVKYSTLKKHYLEILQAEDDAEEMQAQLGIALTKSSGDLSSSDYKLHKSNANYLRKLQKKYNSRKFNLFAYLYQANFYLEIREYEQIIKLVDEGLDFFRKKGIKSIDADFSLRTRGGIACFMMKEYDKAEKLFEDNLAISSPKIVNWYTTYNFLFSLKINQLEYLKAYDILSIVINQKDFNIAHPLLIQLFKIKEAYIHFLIQLGKIDPSKSNAAPLRKFRLNRFLNDVPTYSKDKRGVNISILIIQMLLLVQNKKHGEIIDRLDALNMYSHRYLRSDNTFRSNCFIKMLTKLPDADYHPIRWQRYVKKFRDRLDELPFELSYHNLDLEVIPFETLYDLVVEMLEKQSKGR